MIARARRHSIMIDERNALYVYAKKGGRPLNATESDF